MKFSKARFLRILAVGAAMSLPLLASQIKSFADPLAPPHTNPMEETLKGKSCEIWDDEQGIPHIHASDERVGIACLGYVHARDRAWQMDYFKKTVQGRKAEFFGSDSIRSDFMLRLLGLQEKANSIFQEMTQEEQEYYWAYTWGVNRGMKEAVKKGVYEFQKYNYAPDTWRPQDTIAVSLLQSFDQTRRTFVTQLEDYERSLVFGEQAYLLFNPIGLPWDTSILKSADFLTPLQSPPTVPTLPQAAKLNSGPYRVGFPHLDEPLDLSSLEPILGGPGMGSNSWVLSPKNSKSGKAWLANDPHLKLTRPTFWQWVHLDTGKTDAIGASFPGVPFIFSGTNRHVSWGITNSFLPAAKVSFVAEKELAQAKTFRPLIWVKVWKVKLPFFFKSFQRTATQLPLLPIPNSPKGKAVVLRWTGYDLKAKDFSSLLHLMQAQTVREMDANLAQSGVPSWNFNFADDQGSIGYRATGRIFRPAQRNTFSILTQTLQGVANDPEFSTPLTPEEMPHLLNPDRGFITTANNNHWPTEAPLQSGRAPYTGFRAFRIEELLHATPQHDLESNRKIQCDVQAVDARFLLPKLLTTLAIAAPFQFNEKETAALHLLKTWNFETDVQCLACGIFRTWVNLLYTTQKLNEASLYRTLNSNTSSEWKNQLVSAFQEAVAQLTNKGENPFPKWGELHVNYFRHLADPEFQKTAPTGTPGDEHTVNPGIENNQENRFEHTDGASQRLIVEMTSPPQIYSILPGTNADRPTQDLNDPHSPWQDWVQCRLKKRNFPVDWSKLTSKTTFTL